MMMPVASSILSMSLEVPYTLKNRENVKKIYRIPRRKNKRPGLFFVAGIHGALLFPRPRQDGAYYRHTKITVNIIHQNLHAF